jgi:hypothetical protein
MQAGGDWVMSHVCPGSQSLSCWQPTVTQAGGDCVQSQIWPLLQSLSCWQPPLDAESTQADCVVSQVCPDGQSLSETHPELEPTQTSRVGSQLWPEGQSLSCMQPPVETFEPAMHCPVLVSHAWPLQSLESKQPPTLPLVHWSLEGSQERPFAHEPAPLQ